MKQSTQHLIFGLGWGILGIIFAVLYLITLFSGDEPTAKDAVWLVGALVLNTLHSFLADWYGERSQ